MDCLTPSINFLKEVPLALRFLCRLRSLIYSRAEIFSRLHFPSGKSARIRGSVWLTISSGSWSLSSIRGCRYRSNFPCFFGIFIFRSDALKNVWFLSWLNRIGAFRCWVKISGDSGGSKVVWYSIGHQFSPQRDFIIANPMPADTCINWSRSSLVILKLGDKEANSSST